MAKKKVTPDPISSYKQRTVKEKVEYTATPTGFIRAIAIVDYTGMTDIIFTGDVIDLPERRFKSLSSRGYVIEYGGDIKPTGKR